MTIRRKVIALYRPNLTPAVWPRRQTTAQLRPVLASRANASRKLAGNTMGSSVVTFAPVADKSSTMHWRVAKPPSKVIHPGWRSDLRGSRCFISPSISVAPARIPQKWIAVLRTGYAAVVKVEQFLEVNLIQKALAMSLPQQALKTFDASQRIKGVCVAGETFHLPSKPDCRRLARPRKRHYTFARRHQDQFATVPVWRHPKPKPLICRVYLFATKARC